MRRHAAPLVAAAPHLAHDPVQRRRGGRLLSSSNNPPTSSRFSSIGRLLSPAPAPRETVLWRRVEATWRQGSKPCRGGMDGGGWRPSGSFVQGTEEEGCEWRRGSAVAIMEEHEQLRHPGKMIHWAARAAFMNTSLACLRCLSSDGERV